jgi:hypothetical protein
MLLTDTINIKEVMLFPAMKPDTNAAEEKEVRTGADKGNPTV